LKGGKDGREGRGEKTNLAGVEVLPEGDEDILVAKSIMLAKELTELHRSFPTGRMKQTKGIWRNEPTSTVPKSERRGAYAW
jgi:hypothetical protein